MDNRDDIWTKLDAQIEAYEQNKKSKAQKCAKRTDVLMKTLDIFQESVVDYIPIAKHYGVKCKELVFYKKSILGNRFKTISVPAYYLIYCGVITHSDATGSLYISKESGKLLYGFSYSDENFTRAEDFTLAHTNAIKEKLYAYLDSDSYLNMHLQNGSNYIYGNLLDSLIRLTYNFSVVEKRGINGMFYDIDFQWDKPRTDKEIQNLIQEFFVDTIRESRIKN